MIYTKKTPWTLIMGVIMAAYAYMVSTGAMEPLLKLLHTGSTLAKWSRSVRLRRHRDRGRPWQLLATPKQGQGDYYLSTIAGVTFIMLIAFVVKWGLDPLMGTWGKALKPTLGFDIHSVLNLNYVVMGIIAGIIVVNVFKIPDWAQNGVRLSRLVSRPASSCSVLCTARGAGTARQAVGGTDRFLRARFGRYGAVDGCTSQDSELHGRRALGRSGRVRRVRHSRGGSGCAGEVF